MRLRSFRLALDSDMYGSGHNEELLRPLLQEQRWVSLLGPSCFLPIHPLLTFPDVVVCRDNIFIGTKFGFVRGPGGSWDGIRGDAVYVKEACEASLKRLGVETIDLYCGSPISPGSPSTRSLPGTDVQSTIFCSPTDQHRVDANTPIEDTVRAMKELQDAGKVRRPLPLPLASRVEI